MARARIAHRWNDGSDLTVEVSVSESCPDSVSEAKANAKALWLDVLGVTVETLSGDGNDDE